MRILDYEKTRICLSVYNTRNDYNDDMSAMLCLYTLLSECIDSEINPAPRGCAGGRIGTRFLRPRGTGPLKGANPGV